MADDTATTEAPDLKRLLGGKSASGQGLKLDSAPMPRPASPDPQAAYDEGMKLLQDEKKSRAPYEKLSRDNLDKIFKNAEDLKAMSAPPAPKLQDVPPAPDAQYKDPTQALGSLASVLAIFGSLKTRAPFTSALRSASAAMQGAHQGDVERVKLERQKWHDNMEAGLKQNQLEMDRYAAAMQSSNFDLAKARPLMQALAAEDEWAQMRIAAEHGDYKTMHSLIDTRTKTQVKLTEDYYKDQEHRLRLMEMKERREQAAQARQDARADANERFSEMMDFRRSQSPTAQTIDPQTVDFYAKQSIAGDNSWQVGLARGKVGQALISAVKDRTPTMASELGLTPQDVGSNKATNVALSSALRDRTKFVAAGQQFVKNMNSQIALVEKYLEPGAAGSVPAINKWIQAGRVQLAGDPDVSALDTAIRGLAREHQRIVTGVTSNAQLHVASQATADELLNRAQTPEQIRMVLQVMKEEASNAVASGQSEVGDLQKQLQGLGRPKDAPTGRRSTDAQPATTADPKDGDKSTSKSGKPIHFDGTQWVYD